MEGHVDLARAVAGNDGGDVVAAQQVGFVVPREGVVRNRDLRAEERDVHLAVVMLHFLRRLVERSSEDRRELRVEARLVGEAVAVDPDALGVHDRDVVVLGVPAPAAAGRALMRARVAGRVEDRLAAGGVRNGDAERILGIPARKHVERVGERDVPDHDVARLVLVPVGGVELVDEAQTQIAVDDPGSGPHADDGGVRADVDDDAFRLRLLETQTRFLERAGQRGRAVVGRV